MPDAVVKQRDRVTWNLTSTDLATGVSPNIPKPNVVRIEQLSPYVRERYLSGKFLLGIQGQKGIYSGSKDNEVGVTYNAFYGFTHKDNDVSIGITNDWGGNNATGMMSQIGGFLSKLDMKAGGSLGIPGVAGGSVDINATKLIGNGMTFVDNLLNNANSMLGLSNKSVGGASLKDFTGVNLNSLSVRCAWYLPEQEILAREGLKTLYRMAYPQLPGTMDILEGMWLVLSTMINSGIDNVAGAVETVPIPGSSKLASLIEMLRIQQKPPTSNASEGSGKSDGVSGFANTVLSKLYQSYNDLDGFTSTVNPLPVRLSVGHYLDIEPLVINNVKTTFSKETFINDIGLHLPIYADVTITFSYWINPTPDHQFFKLLNTEIFGNPSDIPVKPTT